ncbi:hypothetical protein ACFMQL_31205 [Nonomuraea fastidiosa]|jgi:hypothetical protein|uniref:hypothetical protein n=1 Tax=Nonomuraea TaxID=83681 RepID=UPI00324F86DB
MQKTLGARARPDGAAGRISAGLLYGLRLAVTAQAAALLVAAAFAGQAAGNAAMAEAHIMAGMVVHVVAFVQIVLAVLFWRPGGGAGGPALGSIALFAVGLAQHVTLPVAHPPSGVILLVLILALLFWVWLSPSATWRR